MWFGIVMTCRPDCSAGEADHYCSAHAPGMHVRAPCARVVSAVPAGTDDLPWCSRLVHHQSGVQEALGLNPGWQSFVPRFTRVVGIVVLRRRLQRDATQHVVSLRPVHSTLGRTRFTSQHGCPRIFICGNCAGRCCWLEGFLRDLSSPLSLHFGTATYSCHFTLIGSRYLYVKRSPDLFTHSKLEHYHEILTCACIPRLLRPFARPCTKSAQPASALYECRVVRQCTDVSVRCHRKRILLGTPTPHPAGSGAKLERTVASKTRKGTAHELATENYVRVNQTTALQDHQSPTPASSSSMPPLSNVWHLVKGSQDSNGYSGVGSTDEWREEWRSEWIAKLACFRQTAIEDVQYVGAVVRLTLRL
ncbi:hypothetical protein PR048_023938 [Dryococelus australis]|uniref:Uncharacterized protein n=1 Tax=Dryococelus australis TaxID=614101 RepID=A0ABQ9GVG6_9NEOP|nr:hypothetical protein PR048_023938 [Dryococelus australis]